METGRPPVGCLTLSPSPVPGARHFIRFSPSAPRARVLLAVHPLPSNPLAVSSRGVQTSAP